jgi:hypothetical protein
MGKLKEQMIIDAELAAVAAESWEHSVMANLRDFITAHGVQDFKDALHTFDVGVYKLLFKESSQCGTPKCALTETKHAHTS